MLRKFVIGVAVIATIVAGVGTARLVLPRADPTRGVVKQLAFLRAEIEAGADHAAQKQYPEGYFFLNALYGLSWVQVGLTDPDRSVDAAAEARWALDRLQSADGTAPFDVSLKPRYGVFHAGWTNWLRGGIIALKHSDAAGIDEFTSRSVEIATAFRTARTPYLESYPGQAWPVDSVVAIASLRLYDDLVAPRFGQIATNWVAAAKTKLDPATGLLPHQVAPATIGARASSQGMIQRFLVDIDPAFARAQYEIFKDRFGNGIGVREYPKGTAGQGDGDSGPLILDELVRDRGRAGRGAGPARSGGRPAVPGRRTARAAAHRAEDEALLFGAMPIGDAFLAWSASARPLVATEQPKLEGGSPWWWLPWLLVLWLPALILWGFVRFRPRRRRGRAH